MKLKKSELDEFQEWKAKQKAPEPEKKPAAENKKGAVKEIDLNKEYAAKKDTIQPPKNEAKTFECGNCGAKLPSKVTSCTSCGVEFE